MRTTITLDDDVAAEVERLRRAEGIGVSESVNRLIRSGLAQKTPRVRYRHQAEHIGFKVDVTNIGEVLDLLDDM